jgi:hypothetical protein
MANIRIKDLATTATATSSDDYLAIDGASSNTRKISAYNPAVNSIMVGDGAVGTPSVSFTSDTDTGIYRIGANSIGVAANGAKVLDISTTGLSINGVLSLVKNAAYASTIEGAQTVAATGNSFLFKNSGAVTLLTLAYDATATFAGAIRAADGTAAAPSISFASDTTKGWYSNAVNEMALSLAGGFQLKFQNGGYVTGGGGEYIRFQGNGALVLASAANQNITLTPSGTGVVSIIPVVSSGYGCGLEIYSAILTTYKIAELKRNNGVGGGEINLYNDTNQLKTRFGTVGDNYTATTLLLGTTTNSANGILQLATHTTLAGGIGFGTDVSLFRAAANVLALDSGDALQLGNAYVNTVAVSTGTVTIRDSTGTVYRLLCVV